VIHRSHALGHASAHRSRRAVARYCLAMAIRRRSSSSMKWSWLSVNDESPAGAGPSDHGRYWARTSDLLLVEQALSQLS
jgi:hypothetical protein